MSNQKKLYFRLHKNIGSYSRLQYGYITKGEREARVRAVGDAWSVRQSQVARPGVSVVLWGPANKYATRCLVMNSV
jgi:hypothetical protein